MTILRAAHFLLILFATASTCIASVHPELESSRALSVRHLTSYTKHMEFLHQALSEAKKSVLITSYSISPDTLFGQDVDQSIVNACNRGVKVYIYFKNLNFYNESDFEQLNNLSHYCERLEQNDNHSKCIAIDGKKIAIGSHNWLSENNQKTLNSSLVATGQLVKCLIQDVWQGIRFYQNLEYDNEKGIAAFYSCDDAFSTGSYQFSSGEFYYTLRTPEAHSALFEDEVIKKARNKVVIASPFIKIRKLKTVLSPSSLSQLEERGVKTHLFTLPSPCRVKKEKADIFNYLEKLKKHFPHFSYSTYYNLHAKTIIADDLLCEGSFNLLSAVESIDHTANNFEMSLAIRGAIATPLIMSFYQSKLGLRAFPSSFKAKRKAPLAFDNRTVSTREEGVPSRPAKKRNNSSFSSSKAFQRELNPLSGAKIKIFSGERFNIQGFCVRLGSDYIRDSRGKTLYFQSREAARSIAENTFLALS